MSSTKHKANGSQDEILISVKKENKNCVVVFIGFFLVILVAVIAIVILFLVPKKVGESSDFDLKLVHLVFRHGDRTPVTPTYPLDPYINETYEPYGHGELTEVGFLTSYNLGKSFKKRYESFVGPVYQQSAVYAQSTEYTRTKLSLELMIAGFYSEGNDLDLTWRPAAFLAEKPDNNSLLYPLHLPCNRFLWEFSANYAPVVTKNKKLFESFENFTGKPFIGPFDVIKLYYDLKTQVEYGLKLPLWASEYFPEKLQALSNEAWGYFVYSDVWKRIHGGSMLKRLISDWEAAITETSSKKLFLWSAHDSTVVGVLGAFNLWDDNVSPDYGITAIFELKQNRKTDEYGVEVYLKKKVNDEPILLTIPGCNSFCPLSKLKILLENHLPRAGDCD